MNATDFVFYTVIGLVALAAAWCIYFEKKTSRELDAKDKAEREAQDKAFQDELAKPRSFVRFVDVNGVKYDTEVFEPSQIRKRYYYQLLTSKMTARRHIRNCYERGFFEDENGLTLPVDKIMKAYVLKVEAEDV